jgi:hypothetical protein
VPVSSLGYSYWSTTLTVDSQLRTTDKRLD